MSQERGTVACVTAISWRRSSLSAPADAAKATAASAAIPSTSASNAPAPTPIAIVSSALWPRRGQSLTARKVRPISQRLENAPAYRLAQRMNAMRGNVEFSQPMTEGLIINPTAILSATATVQTAAPIENQRRPTFEARRQTMTAAKAINTINSPETAGSHKLGDGIRRDFSCTAAVAALSAWSQEESRSPATLDQEADAPRSPVPLLVEVKKLV